MGVRLPDENALGARPVPRGQRAFATQDTTAAGEATARLGQTLAGVGEDFAKRNDEQKVLEYRRKLIEWDKANVHDPEKGAASKRGKDAFDLAKTLPVEFDTFAQEAAEGLTSNRQRAIANEMATGRRESIINWASGHAMREREKFAGAEYEANISASKDQATLYPALAKAELAAMAANTQAYIGKRLGPEAVAAKIRADASEVHTRIVSTLVKDGNVAGAEAHFKANAADMNTQARDVAQGLLKEVGTRQKVQAFEDGIRATDMPLSEALSKAREQFVSDPVSRDAAVAQVKTLYAEREAVKAQAVKAVSTEAWSVLMAKGSMSAIPTATMTALRKTAPEEERQMRDWLEAKWRRAKADAEGSANDVTPERAESFVGLMDMAANEPAKFATLDLRKYMPYLARQHLERLVTVRAGINKKEAEATDVVKLTQSTMKVIDQAMAGAGIKLTGARSERQQQEADLFKTRLFDSIQEAADGGKLDTATARQIGLNLLREGIEQGSGIGGWFATTKKGFQMEPGKTYIAKRYADIPLEARSALADELVSRGQAQQTRGGDYILNDAQKAAIERAYQRGLERGVFK